MKLIMTNDEQKTYRLACVICDLFNGNRVSKAGQELYDKTFPNPESLAEVRIPASTFEEYDKVEKNVDQFWDELKKQIGMD
ncbi:hypothetical protein [Paraflavitalea sp. CAU 1676]|uniref:hypothetical protein n=1 Tax=Paraflavitalea sp. CAU 1676 TaxID=3032598 RepID=UPI0023DC5717|nr:hypothetical protein [Paraflavitalea sp. CAU 1676]MDF2190489.1 hypothetical protein [Paraflavitalea sp. CAU 1676]